MQNPAHRRHHPFPKGLLGVGLLVCLSVPSHAAKLPRIINSTNSVVVKSVSRDHSGYTLTLRNTAPVAVYGLAVAVVAKNGTCDLYMMESTWGSFMDPLGNRELEPLPLPRSSIGPFPLPRSNSQKNRYGPRIGSCADSGVRALEPDNLPEIVIETVDFENGAFEGNLAEAAMFEANKFGRNSQGRRIADIVESQLNGEGSENLDWVGILARRVSALSDAPNPEAVQSIEDRFGPAVTTQLATTSCWSIQQEVQSGSAWARILFTNNLKAYALVSSRQGLPLVSLRTWWNATKGECDYFAPWCRDGSWQKRSTVSQVSSD